MFEVQIKLGHQEAEEEVHGRTDAATQVFAPEKENNRPLNSFSSLSQQRTAAKCVFAPAEKRTRVFRL